MAGRRPRAPAPRGRPLGRAPGVSGPPPLPVAVDNLQRGGVEGSEGYADAAGPRSRLGEGRRARAGRWQVLSPGVHPPRPPGPALGKAGPRSPPPDPTPSHPLSCFAANSWMLPWRLGFGEQKGGRLDEGGSLTPSTLGPSVASPSFFSPTLPLLGLGAPSIAGKVGRRFSQKWLGKEGGRKSSG